MGAPGPGDESMGRCDGGTAGGLEAWRWPASSHSHWVSEPESWAGAGE